jgi:hypothetical protein
MMSVSFCYADDTVRGNSGFMAVENDIPNGDGCGSDWCNCEDITIAYRGVHTVARRTKANGMTTIQSFFKQFREQISIINPESIPFCVRSASLEERFT